MEQTALEIRIIEIGHVRDSRGNFVLKCDKHELEFFLSI